MTEQNYSKKPNIAKSLYKDLEKAVKKKLKEIKKIKIKKRSKNV